MKVCNNRYTKNVDIESYLDKIEKHTEESLSTEQICRKLSLNAHIFRRWIRTNKPDLYAKLLENGEKRRKRQGVIANDRKRCPHDT